MLLQAFAMVVLLYAKTAFGWDDIAIQEPTSRDDVFDFSSMDEEIEERLENSFNVELASVSISGIAALNSIPEMHLERRIKRLQSFHADWMEISSEGSTLESDVYQLMQIHGVTADTVEGNSQEEGALGISANTFSKDDTNDEHILKKVQYLENTFHKEDIAKTSNPSEASACLNGGVSICKCADTYYGDTCEQKDDDECTLGTDDCDKQKSSCVNTPGSFICKCKEGFTDIGMGCSANECKTQPELSGAKVTHVSEDGLEVTYVCRDDFLFLYGNPKAKCNDKTGVWDLSTMTCAPTQCYYNIDGKGVYAGTKNTVMTSSGEVPCQRFDAETPHGHRYKFPYLFHVSSLVEASNYCRNPDAVTVPWCYTSNPDDRWEFCDVPKCNTGPGCSIAPFIPGAKVTSMKRYPNGKVVAEYECLEDLVKIHNSTGVCTDDASGHGYWDVHPLICGPTNCYMLTGSSSVYLGTQSITKSGLTCQRWDSQSPHKHEYSTTDEWNQQMKSLDEVANYCRVPFSTYSPWCYTTDENKKYEYCDIKPCAFMG